MSWSGEERRQQPRWSDDRLDDLATLVRHSDERLDAIHNLVAAHDLQIIELLRDKRATEQRSFSLRLVVIGSLFTFLLTEIGTLVAVLLQH